MIEIQKILKHVKYTNTGIYPITNEKQSNENI